MIFPGDLSVVLALVGAGAVDCVVVDGVECLSHGAVVGDVGPVDVEVVPGPVINPGRCPSVRALSTGHGWGGDRINILLSLLL